MAPKLRSLRKRRHPFRIVLLALLILGGFLLLLLFMLVFQERGDAIGLGMFGAIALFFLLHYLLWGRALSAEVASRSEARRSPALAWPDTDIPADVALLPSGEKQTEPGIQCAAPLPGLKASRIQRPQNPNP